MLTKLEQGLGYTFRNKALLENALTHSSYANENRERHLPDNERLEFLGDSILGFVVAEYLYRNFPDKPEGELTRIRADLVCERNLAEAAATIELGSYLLLGQTSSASAIWPRPPRRSSWGAICCSATARSRAADASAIRSCRTRWSRSLRRALWTAALPRRRRSSTG